MELANRRAVVHGVEGSDLVDTGRGHLKEPGDLIHDGDGREAVLALAQVEQGHHGGLLVLWRVSLKDLGHESFILRVELERDVRVVVGCVSVLERGEREIVVSNLPSRESLVMHLRPRVCVRAIVHVSTRAKATMSSWVPERERERQYLPRQECRFSVGSRR